MIWSIRGNACLLVLLGSLIAGLAVGDSKQVRSLTHAMLAMNWRLNIGKEPSSQCRFQSPASLRDAIWKSVLRGVAMLHC